jgi:hypothetical protein
VTRRTRVTAASLVAVVAVLGVFAAGAAGSPSTPQVTVISDSVLTSILWYQPNVDVLSQGVTLDMQVAVGRRLAGQSIPFEGSTAPTLMDLVPTLHIAPTVVVEMGYNDDPARFHDEAEQAIDLLLARGAQRIVWVTLSESKPEFTAMNRDLTALLLVHPQLTLADWNRYSQGHNDWFQTDHLHLMPAGGHGMATLLHAALSTPLAGSGTTVALPRARQRHRFHARLHAPSGTGPFQWRLSGRLPRGLHLTRTGTLSGVPRQRGRFRASAIYETGDALIGDVKLTMAVRRTPQHGRRTRG